jgi:hypothetical protein
VKINFSGKKIQKEKIGYRRILAILVVLKDDKAIEAPLAEI